MLTKGNIYKAMQEQIIKKEGWERAIKYDGDRTFELQFRNEEEKQAAEKIASVLKDMPSINAHQVLTEMAKMPTEQMKILSKNPALFEIWFDPTLSQHQKKLRSLPFLRKIREERNELTKKNKKRRR